MELEDIKAMAQIQRKYYEKKSKTMRVGELLYEAYEDLKELEKRGY